jgi:hypothetical protein
VTRLATAAEAAQEASAAAGRAMQAELDALQWQAEQETLEAMQQSLDLQGEQLAAAQAMVAALEEAVAAERAQHAHADSNSASLVAHVESMTRLVEAQTAAKAVAGQVAQIRRPTILRIPFAPASTRPRKALAVSWDDVLLQAVAEEPWHGAGVGRTAEAKALELSEERELLLKKMETQEAAIAAMKEEAAALQQSSRELAEAKEQMAAMEEKQVRRVTTALSCAASATDTRIPQEIFGSDGNKAYAVTRVPAESSPVR